MKLKKILNHIAWQRISPGWIALLLSAVGLFYTNRSFELSEQALLQSQTPTVQIELIPVSESKSGGGTARLRVRNLSRFPLIGVESSIVGYVADVLRPRIVYRAVMLQDPLKTSVLEPFQDYFLSAEDLSSNASDSALFPDYPASNRQTNFRALVIAYYREVDHRRFVRSELLHIYFREEFRSGNGRVSGKGPFFAPPFQQFKGITTSGPEPEAILNLAQDVDWLEAGYNRADR